MLTELTRFAVKSSGRGSIVISVQIRSGSKATGNQVPGPWHDFREVTEWAKSL